MSRDFSSSLAQEFLESSAHERFCDDDNIDHQFFQLAVSQLTRLFMESRLAVLDYSRTPILPPNPGHILSPGGQYAEIRDISTGHIQVVSNQGSLFGLPLPIKTATTPAVLSEFRTPLFEGGVFAYAILFYRQERYITPQGQYSNWIEEWTGVKTRFRTNINFTGFVCDGELTGAVQWDPIFPGPVFIRNLTFLRYVQCGLNAFVDLDYPGTGAGIGGDVIGRMRFAVMRETPAQFSARIGLAIAGVP